MKFGRTETKDAVSSETSHGVSNTKHQHSRIVHNLFYFILFLVFLLFLGPLPRHMEVPRLGIESEL